MKQKINFYDTNCLLHNELENFEDTIYLSSITLQEIENIKVSDKKDGEVKFNARKATRWLRENEEKYVCIPVRQEHYKLLEKYKMPIDNDNLIIACGKLLEKEFDVTFYTDDLCCYNIAKTFGMKCSGSKVDDTEKEIYKGYKEVTMDDFDYSDFANNDERKNKNEFELLVNEYLLINNSMNTPIDCYVWDGKTLEGLVYGEIRTKMFDTVKPKDFIQQMAIHALATKKLILLKGRAGTAKTLFSMAYLMKELEHGRINKIAIVVDPNPVKNSQKLGFYTGDRNQKLMGGMLGGIINSKFGDPEMAQSMLENHLLEIVPMCDIRGMQFDKTGVYCVEAQNLDTDLMKLLISRIGEQSFCIIDGDNVAQIDNSSARGISNGMRRLSEVFRGYEDYAEVELKHVYRSKLADKANEM